VDLVGVEIAGFGVEGAAAVEVQDLMCAHRWPARPKNATFLGSSIWGSRGAGLVMQGCVAEMLVRALMERNLVIEHFAQPVDTNF
jgi:hypothetical protein